MAAELCNRVFLETLTQTQRRPSRSYPRKPRIPDDHLNALSKTLPIRNVIVRSTI